jgi:hypothetical protein
LTYKIARDGQEFGPYSLADVQRYVGTGNILLTDFALAEGATEWIPVAQVVGTIAVAPARVPAAYGAAAMPQFPDPPNLHWALVLLIGMLTCGFFVLAWDVVQAIWIKKVQPETKAFFYVLIFLGLEVVNVALAMWKGFMIGMHHMDSSVFTLVSRISMLVGIACFVLLIVYRFVMKSSLERHFNTADPVGLSLSGVMTFFFGGLYFQYHLTRINEIKRAYRLSNPY